MANDSSSSATAPAPAIASKETTGASHPEVIVDKSVEMPTYYDSELVVMANDVLGLGTLNAHDQQTNAHIIRQWRNQSNPRSAVDVYCFIHGLADMRDRDMVGWDSAKPGTPMTLRAGQKAMTVADQGDGTVLRNLYDVAIEHHRKQEPVNAPGRSSLKRINV